jgi:hypothetical protein
MKSLFPAFLGIMRRFQSRGTTLVEVMLAMVILALAMIPLAGVMHWGVTDTDYTGQYMGAMQGAQRILNTLLDNAKFSDIRASLELTGPGANDKWQIVNLADLKQKDSANPGGTIAIFPVATTPNGPEEFVYEGDPRGTWRYADPQRRVFKVYYKLDFQKIDKKHFHFLKMPVATGSGVVSTPPPLANYEVYITDMSQLSNFRSKGQGLYKITLWVTWDPSEQLQREGGGVGLGRRDATGALVARSYALVTFKADLDL